MIPLGHLLSPLLHLLAPGLPSSWILEVLAWHLWSFSRVLPEVLHVMRRWAIGMRACML